MHQARDALTRTCGDIHFEVRGKSEDYLHGAVPGTAVVIYINGEGAQIFDGTREVFWSDYHDYETPTHLIYELVASAKDAIASAKTAKLKYA